MTAHGTVVVIGGPTASGKTHAAAALGQQLGTEVISADSRQFYHAMRIGTARPKEEELLGVKHHFLGHLELEQVWSAGAFARAAETVLQDLLKEHGIAVLVGGSGLYIDALIKGLDPLPAGDPVWRERIQQRFSNEGLAPLLKELEALDPVCWQQIDRRNPHRVIRALEVCHATGRPYSSQRNGAHDRTDLRIVRIWMDLPREALYARIDQRVDQMIAAGLAEEARSLLPYREHNALRTVGYRELFEHFDRPSPPLPPQEGITLAQAITSIKQHTRNYAKRQLTWSRRDPWYKCGPLEHEKHIQLANAAS